MADEIKKDEIMEETMDWDSGIENVENEYNLPPEGEYDFTVVEFEKTTSKAGKKMAKINLKLVYDEQSFRVYDYLVLQENMKWKLQSFFECVGLKKKGEDLARMPWDKVLGSKGRVKIKHEEYNGEPQPRVDRYIITAASQAAKSTKDMPFEL